MRKQRREARYVQADTKKTAAQKPIWGAYCYYLKIMVNYIMGLQCARHWVGILTLSYCVTLSMLLCLSFHICKMVPTLRVMRVECIYVCKALKIVSDTQEL